MLTFVRQRRKKKRTLPSASLDIFRINNKTKKCFYSASENRGAWQLPDCSYHAKSSHKLLDHLVAHNSVCFTDCGYVMGHRYGVIKHLKLSHGSRKESSTQVDASSWPRLYEANSALPPDCSSQSMRAQRYCSMGSCF